MGSGIPEAIGVAYGNKGKQVYCFVGDGSFPLNIQELQLIKDNNLPIKIFVFNNDGYVSIRSTQRDFLDGNFVGSDVNSGLHLPDTKNIAQSFGIEYFSMDTHEEVRERPCAGAFIPQRKPPQCQVDQ